MNPQKARTEQRVNNGLLRQQKFWSALDRKCAALLNREHTRSSVLQLHAFILQNGLDSNLYFFTSFIAACFAIGRTAAGTWSGMEYACRVFDQRPCGGDTFLCNFMIKSLKDQGRFANSLLLYGKLRRETSFTPDQVTFLSLAKSCSSGLTVWDGKQLHDHLMKHGFSSDLFVGTAFVELYGKFGDMVSAQKLFDGMPRRSQVSWTNLVRGYAMLGNVDKARKYFNDMPEKDSVAVNSMIYGYVMVGDMGSAQALFDIMGDKTLVSWTTMISGYCKNNDVNSARVLFNSMPKRNLITWNSMISGYSGNKQPEEALMLFHELLSSRSFEPNEVTIMSIIPAISNLGALDVGFWVHQYVQTKGFDRSTKVCTAVLDMFSKCGEIDRAMHVFESIKEKNTASWNAMIFGLAINNRCKEALDLFEEMIAEGCKPNYITMSVILYTCNQGGYVEQGKRWLTAMQETFALTPQIEHYGCMINLLARAGCLEEAERIMECMPCKVNGMTMSFFLSVCGHYGDLSRADKLLKKAVLLEPSNGGNYISMMNLYAMEMRWGDVEELRILMSKSGAKKQVGYSAIKV